ncbi:MAG: hypothetical protein WA555_12910 [Candidatus Sulfotelmatobacter sp.]
MTANATTPTSVQNVSDPTNHPYQEFASTSCTGLGLCAVQFPAITTDRTLILHASCSFELPTGTSTAGSIGGAYLVHPNSNPYNALQAFVYTNSGGVTNFGINSETYLFFTKGQIPEIDVFGNNAPVVDLSCTLSGYYY